MRGKIQRGVPSIVGSSSDNSAIGLGLSPGALTFGTLKPQEASFEFPDANRKVEVSRIGMQERLGISVHSNRRPSETLARMFADPLVHVATGIGKALG